MVSSQVATRRAGGITANAALQKTIVGLQSRNSPRIATGAKMSRTLKYLVIGYLLRGSAAGLS